MTDSLPPQEELDLSIQRTSHLQEMAEQSHIAAWAFRIKDSIKSLLRRSNNQTVLLQMSKKAADEAGMHHQWVQVKSGEVYTPDGKRLLLKSDDIKIGKE